MKKILSILLVLLLSLGVNAQINYSEYKIQGSGSNPTVAVYGEQVLTNSVIIPTSSTNAGNATDILSFTLPSAGVYVVETQVRSTTPNMGASIVTGMVAIITNNTNVVQANSETTIGRYQNAGTGSSLSNIGLTGNGKIFIVANSAGTYKLRVHHDGTNSTDAFNVQSDNNGRTKVSWIKL